MKMTRGLCVLLALSLYALSTAAQNRTAAGTWDGVGFEAEGFDAIADGAHLFFCGVGLHDNKHGECSGMRVKDQCKRRRRSNEVMTQRSKDTGCFAWCAGPEKFCDVWLVASRGHKIA